MDKIQIIILAAGHGKRMNNGDLPKVLVPFKGQPMIKHLLKSIKDSGVCDKPAIVVGQGANQVKEALGPDYIYILQPEQLGTGHAVSCAKEILEDQAENIIVLYGDHPLVSAAMIRNLADSHLKNNKVITMAIVKTPDFIDWRAGFYQFGRLIRNKDNQVCQIVEVKDASDKEKGITEVNPGYYCFKADWLWDNLDKLKDNNAQHEYYLTDLIAIACHSGQSINTVEIQPQEALGVNTKEQLELLEKIV